MIGCVPLLARPAVGAWFPLRTAGQASSGTHNRSRKSVPSKHIRDGAMQVFVDAVNRAGAEWAMLVAAVLWVGTLYWKLHSLPERMAHRTQKLQFEIVAVLGLISLFTHMHIFWVAGLLLAMVDLPDFGTPLRSIAGSVERIARCPRDAPWHCHTDAVKPE